MGHASEGFGCLTPHSKSYAVSTIIPLVLQLRMLRHRLADLFKVSELECAELGSEPCSSMKCISLAACCTASLTETCGE